MGTHISLHVEKIPVANPVVINPECDFDRDGLFSFDTSLIQSTIIGNQTDIEIRYFDENGKQLSTPLPNPFVTASQNITARITNTNSQDKNGQCSDETVLNFIVNRVPIVNPIAAQEECDTDFDGIISFDTTTIESTILGNQTGLIVKYLDQDNNALPSPLPNPFSTSTQKIKVLVQNPLNDICFEETTIDFVVNKKPSFNLTTEDTICMGNSPKLEIQADNPAGNYFYTWRDESGAIVGKSQSIPVFKGGVYGVIATSDKGCDSEQLSIRVKESSVSNITRSNIEVKDDSDNNYIKVNTSHLGLGNYKFRLLDFNSNILVNYQEENLFDNLEGGNYILEINDKNGCGSQIFEISLISFPNFFSPNGDGKNDFWQIKGGKKSFYKSGTITIFNRYGKIISAFTINDVGWDGTYNGKILNKNDYWFQAILINQNNEVKKRSGHFSLMNN